MTPLDEYKESLVSTIAWYRDHYHRAVFGHDDLIEQVRMATSEEELDSVERVLDDWFDGPPDEEGS